MVLGKFPVSGRPTNLDNQLWQLCTARTAWSDSVIRSALVRFGN